MKLKHKLTREQRDLIDKTVLAVIDDEIRCSAHTISVRLERMHAHELPPRPDDWYRYVDASLQRLRHAGVIETVRDGSWRHWQRKALAHRVVAVSP